MADEETIAEKLAESRATENLLRERLRQLEGERKAATDALADLRTEVAEAAEVRALKTAQAAALLESHAKAKAIVERYVNAQGPHLYESWRRGLIEDCGLVVDEGNPYRPVKAPPFDGLAASRILLAERDGLRTRVRELEVQLAEAKAILDSFADLKLEELSRSEAGRALLQRAARADEAEARATRAETDRDDAHTVMRERSRRIEQLETISSKLYLELINNSFWVNYAGPDGSDLCICGSEEEKSKSHDEACGRWRDAVYSYRAIRRPIATTVVATASGGGDGVDSDKPG